MGLLMSIPISLLMLLTLLTAAVGEAAGGETASLSGDWAFRLDPGNVGEKESWQKRRLPETCVPA